MRVVPAVDIRGGLCVNLVQGDYGQEMVFSDNPVEQAVAWRDLGGEIVHIVDLDGARYGRCCIESELRAMAERGVSFEVGGGIRNIETIRAIFEYGAERAILGTAAHRDPEFVRAACFEFPGRIVAGIDARDGKVSLSGWMEDTQTDAIEFARRMEAAGACRIIFTDISSDGMMKGPNVEATRTLARSVDIPVTASGGVSSLDDIRRICTGEPDGVDEVIVGRALYLKAFTLPEAIAVAQGAP